MTTVSGLVAVGPLCSLKRLRLHAIDDLRLNNIGADPEGNLDKIADAVVKLYKQVRLGKAEGGEIYFPAGTFAINQPLRALPDIAFVGESAEGSVIKNTLAEGEIYWHGGVLFAGHCHPMEGMAGRFRFRPFTTTPEKDSRHVLVTEPDYAQVNVGDEIKIYGATNIVEDK